MLVRIATRRRTFRLRARVRRAVQAKQIIDRLIAPFLTGRTLADPDALRILFQQGPGADAGGEQDLQFAVEIASLRSGGESPQSSGERIDRRAGARPHPPVWKRRACTCRRKATRPKRRGCAKLGFRAYKMRPGRGPEEDIEAVRRCARRSGPDFDIMVDAHTWWRMGDQSYSLETVERLASEMAEYGIRWLEEPFPPDDHEAFLHLKHEGSGSARERRA